MNKLDQSSLNAILSSLEVVNKLGFAHKWCLRCFLVPLGDLAGEVIGSYGKQIFWILFNVLGLDFAGEEHSLLDLKHILFIMHVDGGGRSLFAHLSILHSLT